MNLIENTSYLYFTGSFMRIVFRHSFQVPQKKGSAKKSERKKRRSSFVRGRKERKSLVFSSANLTKSG